MPQIFDDISREKVRCLLLDNGFELIKTYGLKKTSISDITKKAGIATGTFYNFFSTKEEFVYQIVLYKRNAVKEKLTALMKNNKLNKQTFRQYLEEVYLSDNNIFQYLDDREIAQLQARWPEEYWKNSENDEATSTWILDHLDGKRADCDWRTFTNLCKSLVLVGHGKEQLHAERYQETMEILIDAILRYAFT